MRADIADLISHILKRHNARNPYIVGIDGPGASGKSSAAHQIAAGIPETQLVHFDDFYLDGDAMASTGIGRRFDWNRLLRQVILPLRNGENALYQVYDWQLRKLSGWKRVLPNGIVVIEGVYSTRKEIRSLYDLTVFVDASYETRLRRAVERDGFDQIAKWTKEWMPEEMEYVRSDHDPKDSADVTLVGE